MFHFGTGAWLIHGMSKREQHLKYLAKLVQARKQVERYEEQMHELDQNLEQKPNEGLEKLMKKKSLCCLK